MAETVLPTYDFSTMDDRSVARIMEELKTGLTVDEARILQTRILKRKPTLAELILFGIEGSEHCSYKSSRPYLRTFTTDGPQVIIGAKEDAGIVRVIRDHQGKGYAIVLSHESHNHPSQLVPYEGAATGIGGNVRDVCCMGAKVIALADDLRFGDIGLAHNKWLYEGVVSGIAGYGNAIGVPNIGGGLQFDPLYNGNCLVTVVTLGALAEEDIIHSYAPAGAEGYNLILVGKPTDRSGFGGASFASFELDGGKAEKNKGAVQEPNAFLGRHMIKASTQLFARLKQIGALDRVAFKDLGAGGIACASVELVESGGYGAVVDMDTVHVADPTIPAHIILCAETQERYMWIAPPELTPLILSHYNDDYALSKVSCGAAARVIGKVTRETDYVVKSQGRTIVHAPASEVTKGFLYNRELGESGIQPAEPQIPPIEDHNAFFLGMLADENIADRAVLYNCYDKQVQGLVTLEAGSADCGVLKPFDDPQYPPEIAKVGITLTTDQNPRFNRIDPYQGAVNAVAEAYANTAACGAVAVALSDCLCYGNPEKPAQMRQFADGCQGIAESAAFLEVPVIAGNVSLYNESEQGAIPPSPMIAVLGRLEDAHDALSVAFKQAGSDLLMLGERKDECGGSVYYARFGALGNTLPRPDLGQLKETAALLAYCAAEHLILACHDISEGGIAVALAEMSIPSGIGCTVQIPTDLPLERLLYSESWGFVLETKCLDTPRILQLSTQRHIACTRIGTTTESGMIHINGTVGITVAQAAAHWHTGLARRIG
ncbi:MAG: phosphoribosylformylglycinamidine synthase subunit PurL [Sphaerochaetaceae bacterium]